MRCVVIDGSGHPGGHTAACCDAMVRSLAGRGWDMALRSVPVGSSSHCNGCGKCSASGRCVFEDGISALLDEIGGCDLLIIASPIRFSGLSSQVKMLVDRMNPLWHKPSNVPRNMAWVLVGGADDPKFSNAESELTALALGIGSKPVGSVDISGTDHNDISCSVGSSLMFAEDVFNRLCTDRLVRS